MKISANCKVIEAIFRRRTDNARKTWIFRDLPDEDRKLLLKNGGLEPGEEPVIAYLSGSVSWCMVTNMGLVWLGEDGVHHVSIFEIDRITHDMGVAMQNGQMDKRQFHELTIHMKTGEMASVDLEAGQPFYGVWRALYWMLEWANRPEQKAALQSQAA